MYDFLASLPASLMLDWKFHSDTIRRAYPEYADIRFENKAAKRWWSGWHFRRCAREVAEMARRSRNARPGVELAHSSEILSRAQRGIALGNTKGFDWRMTVYAVYLMQLGDTQDVRRKT